MLILPHPGGGNTQMTAELFCELTEILGGIGGLIFGGGGGVELAGKLEGICVISGS